MAYCDCGCGEVVGLRKDNGQPKRFALGHNSRVSNTGGRFNVGRTPWNRGLVMEWPGPNLGRKWSADTIAKAKATRRAKFGGRYTSEEACGWKASADTRKRISEANRLRDLSGDRNPAWRGGRSFEPYPPELNKRLKSMILREQCYLCADCLVFIGRREGARRANVHHRDGNKQNSNRGNLVGLCVSCHTTREWQVTNRFRHKAHLDRGHVVSSDLIVASVEEVISSGLDNATH